MQSTKTEIRRSILERLKKQSPKARLAKSRIIEKRLFQRKEFQRAKTVMFYMSLPEEVNTRRMIRRTLSLGKRVFLPRLEQNAVRPVAIRDPKKDVVPGRFGILEPKKDRRPAAVGEIDLVIVPGVAFDSKGNRLGRGGGYYDRFLRRLKGRIPMIGLAFRLQKFHTLPTSSRDIPVTTLISA